MQTKAAFNWLLLPFCWGAFSANGQEQSVPPVSDTQAHQCSSESALLRLSKAQQQACPEQQAQAADEQLERVEVIGHFSGIQVPEIKGRFVLDRDFLENMPRNGGDFTETLTMIPGVELGDEYLSADSQAEIGAKRVSVWGNEAWQTGFFLDGMNFNSRQDPQSYLTGDKLINDVEGTTQTFNINQYLIDSLEVYTNNVPAQYGGFSGGVVEVNTRDAGRRPEFGISYRTSQSNWNQYRVFQSERDYDAGKELPVTPAFTKNSVNMHFGSPLGEHHSLFVAMNYTDSKITEISLNQGTETQRQNANIIAKLTQKDLWLDEVSLTMNYSPYKNNDILKDVLNSNFEIEGGGFSTTLKAKHDFNAFTMNSRLSFSQSDNSRNAPPHYYPWASAKGKDWGIGDRTESGSASSQGGYGDLNKTQRTYFWDNQLSFNAFSWLGVEHRIDAGVQYQHETLRRQRFYNSYRYNSPIVGVSELNCSGYLFDCVELETSISIAQLEAQLGEPLDLSKPEHVLAYSNIVSMAPQYFALRYVYQQELIDVQAQTLSAFVTDSIEYGDVTLDLGLRADYDDFFKRVNVAPRISGGYRVFGDGDKLFTFGVNRYYSTNLLSYKVKQAELPYLFQRRAINNQGALQGWNDLSSTASYRYLFGDLTTPYNDEITFGWKQSTLLGNWSLEYVKRWRKSSIVAVDDPVYNPTDGYYYRSQTNADTGWSDSIALSWAFQWRNHSLWLNSTYTMNNVYYDRYDDDTNSIEADKLAYALVVTDSGEYRYTETTVANIQRSNEELSQPIRVNLGWTARWMPELSSTVTASFVEAHKSFQQTTSSRASEQLKRICGECISGETLLVGVYQQVDIPDRLLLNLATNWEPEWAKNHALNFRFDIHNIFDSRTYLVSPISTGVETGRSFWLGVGYQWQ